MIDQVAVQRWLDDYVGAWQSYDPSRIGELFSEDARYYADPFDDGLVGRDAIVAEWLGERDEPGTWSASYHPLLVHEDTAVATGTSTYFAHGGEPERVYGNIFVLTFDASGRCREYREWYMRRGEES